MFLIKVTATYVLVLLTWLFFRSTDIETTQIFLAKIINWESSPFAFTFIKITFTFLLMTIFMNFIMYYTKKHIYILSIKNSELEGEKHPKQIAINLIILLIYNVLQVDRFFLARKNKLFLLFFVALHNY
jgi:hypothetical protein